MMVGCFGVLEAWLEEEDGGWDDVVWCGVVWCWISIQWGRLGGGLGWVDLNVLGGARVQK